MWNISQTNNAYVGLGRARRVKYATKERAEVPKVSKETMLCLSDFLCGSLELFF